MNWLHMEHYTSKLTESLNARGVFLVSMAEDSKPNVMTIDWGHVGLAWGNPSVTVFVRQSRYTHSCLEGSSDFTLNVPWFDELGSQLALCGEVSGRDADKISECQFTLVESRKVVTPIIAECPIHFECKILVRAQLSEQDIVGSGMLERHYEHGDHHMMVVAEIVAVYDE